MRDHTGREASAALADKPSGGLPVVPFLPLLLTAAVALGLSASPSEAGSPSAVRAFGAGLAVDGLMQAAVEQEPTPMPTPKPPDANAAPASVSVEVGTVATFASDTEKPILQPSIYIEAEAPVFGGLARVGGRVGITTEPGEEAQPDPTAVQSWRAIEVALQGRRIVSRQEIGGQVITTALVAEWGWTSRLEQAAATPATRLSRHYGVGLSIAEEKSGAEVTYLYGRDESAGDWGWGQHMLWARLPLPFTKQSVNLVVDATLNGGPSRTDVRQRDICRAGITVNMLKLLGGK